MSKGTDRRGHVVASRVALALLAAGSLAMLTAAAFWWWTPAAPRTKADPENPAQVARGEEVYARHCADCHGGQLEGQPEWRVRGPDGRLPAPPHDETGHTWHHPDQVLFEVTKHGALPPYYPEGYESDMPAFGQVLTDDEIRAVLAFIKSTWPDRIRAYQRRLNEAAGEAQ